VFNFEEGIGRDLITDFNPAGDLIILSNSPAGFDPLARLSNTNLGAVLSLDDGQSITFLGRLAQEFGSEDFLIG
jgi:hypothetical protein